MSLPRLVASCAVALVALASTVACDRRMASSSSPAPEANASPRASSAASHRDAGGFVDRQLAMRAAQFAGSMTQVGPVLRGTLAQGGAASHEFEMVGGHCYRIIAVGDIDVNDLDLALYGPDGTQVDSDTEGETYPMLGSTRPLCPPNGGHYRVEVRMHDGQGAYGLEIFRTP